MPMTKSAKRVRTFIDDEAGVDNGDDDDDKLSENENETEIFESDFCGYIPFELIKRNKHEF